MTTAAGLNEKESLSALEASSALSSINWDVRKENYALIVITVLDSSALKPTEDDIEDLGNAQTNQADIQTALAQIQQLFSLVEGSVTSGSKGLPANFFNDPSNYGILQNAASAYNNIFAGNSESPNWNSINFYYTQDGVQKVLPAMDSQIGNEIFEAGGDFQTMFPGLMGPGMPQGSSPLALIQVLVVNEIQTRLDNMPSSEIDSCGGDPIKAALQYGGALSADPMLQALSNVYKSCGTEWMASSPHVSTKGNPTQNMSFANLFENIINDPSGNNAASANAIFGDAAADYYQAQNQTSGSSPTTTAYGGFTDVKIIDTISTTLGNGQSNFQTQSQQNTSNMQQYSSQETSYDNIGQSIISAQNQANGQITHNQLSN